MWIDIETIKKIYCIIGDKFVRLLNYIYWLLLNTIEYYDFHQSVTELKLTKRRNGTKWTSNFGEN